jgi:hypothetical protein
MRSASSRLLAGLASIVSLVVARAAHADVGDADENYDPGKSVRRSGFTFGVTNGFMFGVASGYPNEAEKVGIGRYEARTGAMGGFGGAFWLGGALRDWFVFGVGLSAASLGGKDASYSPGGAFVLHAEGFPLFYKGGPFQDLGLVGEVGIGSRTIQLASRKAADGGSTSFVSLGVLYEPLRIGRHFSGGPIVQIAHEFSESIEATYAVLGIRIAYYGGPD